MGFCGSQHLFKHVLASQTSEPKKEGVSVFDGFFLLSAPETAEPPPSPQKAPSAGASPAAPWHSSARPSGRPSAQRRGVSGPPAARCGTSGAGDGFLGGEDTSIRRCGPRGLRVFQQQMHVKRSFLESRTYVDLPSQHHRPAANLFKSSPSSHSHLTILPHPHLTPCSTHLSPSPSACPPMPCPSPSASAPPSARPRRRWSRPPRRASARAASPACVGADERRGEDRAGV